MKIDYAELLEFMLDFLTTFSRHDCGLILAGYRDINKHRGAYRFLRRLEGDGYVRQGESRKGKQFQFTEKAEQLVRAKSPATHWEQKWDGKWRFVTYDLPESQRTQRIALSRALHGQRLGLLQRSVWVSAHPIEATLLELVKTRGLPECFVGVEGERLLLSSNAELVAAAWDFEDIGRRQTVYLKSLVVDAGAIGKANNLQELARVARTERQSYNYAFGLDPFLPRELYPSVYRGFEVEQKHRRLAVLLRNRALQLAEP
jgi:DNA-binding transcriptional regulator PaaX